MLILLTTIHIIICLFLIMVVLLQQGKGADLSVFGGGSTQAVFGARGAATLLHKLTVAGFIGFIVTTIGIGFLGAGSSRASVMSTVDTETAAPETDQAPAAETQGVATDQAPDTTEPTDAASGEAAPTASDAGDEPADASPPADGTQDPE
jgi:preprotein translocase subunit SecG